MKSKPLATRKGAASRGKSSRAKAVRHSAGRGDRKPARRPAPEKARKQRPQVKHAAQVKHIEPEQAAAPVPVPEKPDTSRPRALAIAQAGLDKKAEDVVVLDVRGLTSYAEYFVLMTAESEPQAGAIADNVDEQLKATGAQRLGVEGQAGGRWVLIDYGDVVAHVFSPEARGFYDLEGLWADAARVPVEE